MKKLCAIIVCLAMLTGFTPVLAQQASVTAEPLRVSVTFDALKEFTLAVGGDLVNVSVIIPDGTEPHDFEPKAQDLVALSTAQVLIYNGLGMEAWIPQAVAAVDNPGLIVVDASTGAEPILNAGEEITEHGQYDPHLWLSPKGAQLEAANIRDALTAADPANAAAYEANYTAFAGQLDSLISEYQAKFSSVSRNNFVTGHAAFGYLCRDFGLVQNSVEDVFAEGEPSAQQLVELVEYCRKNGVTTIFAEEMASPDISATLASEVGAQVKTIYTMESAEDSLSYLERMEINLSEIYESLSE
jgi:zinc transport system substrate-binding protein